MGGFASALSHELNQSLTAATTYLHVAQRMNGGLADGEGPSLSEVIEMASAQMQRARALIGSIRAFMKRGQSMRPEEGIDASIEEASALTQIGIPDHDTQIRFDRGRGWPPHIREQLFRPFVPTKQTGMGLGLPLCHSIIQAHGGRLWAEPHPPGGNDLPLRHPHRQALQPVSGG